MTDGVSEINKNRTISAYQEHYSESINPNTGEMETTRGELIDGKWHSTVKTYRLKYEKHFINGELKESKVFSS